MASVATSWIYGSRKAPRPVGTLLTSCRSGLIGVVRPGDYGWLRRWSTGGTPPKIFTHNERQPGKIAKLGQAV